jgi:hypothetical protein
MRNHIKTQQNQILQQWGNISSKITVTNPAAFTILRPCCSSGFHLKKAVTLKRSTLNGGKNSKEMSACNADGAIDLPAFVNGNSSHVSLSPHYNKHSPTK